METGSRTGKTARAQSDGKKGLDAISRAPGEAVFTRIEPEPASRPGRREYARYSVDLDVSLGSDHNFYAGFAENLSSGGVFVATHLLKPVGEEIQFSIHLPEMNAAITGIGQVRWVREYNERSDLPPGMGISFLKLDGDAEGLIGQFLSRREPLFFDDE
ncbi:MAG TPA: TIGR02266 family protein [Polyangiaceae bacterium]